MLKMIVADIAVEYESLSGQAQFTVEAGDRLIIETPGGGGYGVIEQEDEHSG